MTSQRSSFEYIERYLRNSLDDDAYSEYYGYLNSVWKDAQADQAEYIALLELNNKFKDDANQKLRDALDRLARLGNGPNFGNSKGNDIAREALGETK